MRYRFFELRFRTLVFKKRLWVVAKCDQVTGFICTVYWHGQPIFNLISDRHADSPSPIKHDHEWGIIRWGFAS